MTPRHARESTFAGLPAEFLHDVWQGLALPAKRLPSKYFYDARGSALFEAICETPEYYLTRSELSIMHAHATAMAAVLGAQVRLVEFGNGSGLKTRLLLGALQAPVAYVPVEISSAALAASCSALRGEFPGLPIMPLHADFSAELVLPKPPRAPARSVVYLAGSTIGNFADAEAVELLRHMRRTAGAGGAVLLGIDLKKDSAQLEAAYNDAAGITAAFTLNLLERINRELQADLRLDRFAHRAVYEPVAGRIETDIISTCEQRATIAGRSFHFGAGEAMRVEISCKYSRADLARMAGAAGLRVDEVWTDEHAMFAVALLGCAIR